MAISKVVYDGNTLIDITDSTVSAEIVMNGAVCYGSDGNRIVGNLVIQNYYTGSEEPTSSIGKDGDIYLQVG